MTAMQSTFFEDLMVFKNDSVGWPNQWGAVAQEVCPVLVQPVTGNPYVNQLSKHFSHNVMCHRHRPHMMTRVCVCVCVCVYRAAYLELP